MDSEQAATLSQEAFDTSTGYIDANYRKGWDDSIRAFRNEHASESKYNSEEYKARSHLFRPKTRSIIRKTEAAAAMAWFSNREMVDLTAQNPDDIMNVASAACIKQVTEYRLRHTIRTFPLVIGAVQDAQATGTVCSYNYWDYKKNSQGRVIVDRPCIDLRPVENIRIDPGASWIDPVGTSPYFCDVIPMYVCQVKQMMEQQDSKTQQPKWKQLDDGQLQEGYPDYIDTTYQARIGQGMEAPDQNPKGGALKHFDILWAMRWFMQDSQGEDWVYYTLGPKLILTEPKRLEEVYFHGLRPYTLGCAVIETHKALKSSVPQLVKPLQMEINDVANMRLDNVKFVLHKRWIVARGRQVDVPSLVRGNPGGVTMASNPKEDIIPVDWQDVTSSSYVENDRLAAEFDDLAGNFSPNTKVANNAVNDTLGGSKMANQSAGIMTDYMLMTISETWWEPTIRQLVALEQHYETDEVVLAVCARKAQLFQRWNMHQITDQMLLQPIALEMNAGMGAHNPAERFQKFIIAVKSAIEVIKTAPPGLNVQEAIKEIFSNSGYRNGERFFSGQHDPRLAQAMQMIQQLQQMLEGKQMELQAQAQIEQLKIQSAEKQKSTELQVDSQRIEGDLAIRQAELAVEEKKLLLDQAKLEIMRIEAQATLLQAQQARQTQDMEASIKLEEAQLKLSGEREKLNALAMKIAGEIEKAQIELEGKRTDLATKKESRQAASEEASRAATEVGNGVRAEIDGLKETLKEHRDGISEITKGLGVMFKMMQTPQRKPKGFTLKKGANKKTGAVLVRYDNGDEEEMNVAELVQ